MIPPRGASRPTLPFRGRRGDGGGKLAGSPRSRRIIHAALVTLADVMESRAMRDLLWRVCFRRKIWPHQVTGDAKYGTTENIVAIEDAGIRAHPVMKWLTPVGNRGGRSSS